MPIVIALPAILFATLTLGTGYVIVSFFWRASPPFLLSLAVAFCVGHIMTGVTVFGLAFLLQGSIEDPFRASIIVTSAVQALLVGLNLQEFRRPFRLTIRSLQTAILTGGSLLLSFAIFVHQAASDGERILRSPVYWDLDMHLGRIMAFAQGANFPPEDPHFANAPLVYHFLYHVLEAIYVALGLNVADAITFLSSLSFAALLLAIVGCCEAWFGKRGIGLLAVYFVLIGSGLRFFPEILWAHRHVSKSLQLLFVADRHPYFSAVLKDFFRYNGNMHSLLYYIEERRLIFAVLFLFCISAVVIRLDKLSRAACIFWGSIAGLFFFWHLHILILLVAATAVLFVFYSERRHLVFFAAPMLGLAAAQSLFAAHIVQASQGHALHFSSYPRLDFSFVPTVTSPLDLLLYQNIAVSYGLRLALVFGGYIMLFGRHRRLAGWLLGLGSGLLIAHSVQISPGSIQENHKFVVPSDAVFALVSAYALWHFSLYIGGKASRYSPVVRTSFCSLIAIPLAVLLSLGGWIEIIPFLRSKPTLQYADGSGALTAFARTTPPKSVFATDRWRDVHLAGRLVYLASRVHPALGLNKSYREGVVKQLRAARSTEEVCALLKREQIDYVPLDEKTRYTWAGLFRTGTTEVQTKRGLAVILDRSTACG